MNPKIQKTIAEIGKTKAKITELQARLTELEAQRVDLENTEVIAAFRSVSLAPEEFAEFLRNYTARKPAATPAPVSIPTHYPTTQTEEDRS